MHILSTSAEYERPVPGVLCGRKLVQAVGHDFPGVGCVEAMFGQLAGADK